MAMKWELALYEIDDLARSVTFGMGGRWRVTLSAALGPGSLRKRCTSWLLRQVDLQQGVVQPQGADAVMHGRCQAVQAAALTKDVGRSLARKLVGRLRGSSVRSLVNGTLLTARPHVHA
ncbi:hypothetical protein MF271_23845 (plasmid) [Deinococcus sp. KNUC1210]|uniref:hypothetical protein n=1 Tax=Deinococcus sp. KNUC1210 TaxID=2917691 RepID=UPI001EF071C4|nr:hypothetical protein [Deinococcus sp. KNUC1210]ULH17997.1 hypothetical protein MF271_23845 [Deinococcus sp. KNUC1210]